MTIPARAHFIWIGPRLPWAYAFAVLSAAERGGLDEVVLHHSDALAPGPELAALEACTRVRLRHIDPLDLVARAGTAIGIAEPLLDVYRRLGSAVAKTNILRAAILYLEGGIYLDLDTITVRSLAPLLDAEQFVGCEHIVWPGFVRRSRSPWPWARSLLLDVLRKPMRRVAPGWRWFRHIERFYYLGINNAVLGASAGSRLLEQCLLAVAALPTAQQTKRYALGTNLLQDVVAEYTEGDLHIHQPAVFYPLAPEISEHWFRPRRRIDLAAVLLPATRVVHWYASVRTRSLVDLVDPAYIAAHRHEQLYSALVSRCLPALIPEPLSGENGSASVLVADRALAE